MSTPEIEKTPVSKGELEQVLQDYISEGYEIVKVKWVKSFWMIEVVNDGQYPH